MFDSIEGVGRPGVPKARMGEVVHNDWAIDDAFSLPSNLAPRFAKMSRPSGRLVSAGLLGVVLSLGSLALPASVFAHGGVALPQPGVLDLLLGWSFDPTIQLPLLLTAAAYLFAVRRVDLAHPTNPVPLRRTVAFLAGLGAIEIALQSGIERYDTTLFSVHMVQHLLLTMVAAPLLALGAPITLLLRVARPTPRKRFLLPVLHSRIVRFASFPVVAWLLFAGVMWGTHFSPVFDRSLEEPLVHDLEHLAYLAAGLLFWWPVVGLDPSPWRMAYPVRALYVFLQMPQNTFLSLAILSASAPLYHHYATLQRTWDPTPLADQQLAGGLMWVAGDLALLVSVLAVVVAWMRQEERTSVLLDARLDAGREALREREARLAERLAREREASPGSE